MIYNLGITWVDGLSDLVDVYLFRRLVTFQQLRYDLLHRSSIELFYYNYQVYLRPTQQGRY